ncbi:MAG: ABC transporter ATP-binding protein [Defluviitaleaceae bacterium]|nr:ABC transporter ATP-binding protein [Defluviitaleaceae bacterium]
MEPAWNDKHIISLRNIKMYFQGIKAVDDLSFDINEGEIFGLIGPNGAGKSTLFNCITRFYKPTEGKVYYKDGQGKVLDLDDYKAHDIAKTGIMRTFQNLELVLYVSVLENLLIGGHIYYNSGLFHQFLRTKKIKNEEAQNKARAEEILEKLNLIQYKGMFPAGLPYGVLKKIELARVLMTKPRLIILDEPAAGLNDAETEELAETIRQIRKEYNCTIFLVEHDMNLVMGVCDTVCAISFGKMLAIGTPEEVQNSPLVQEAYLGEKGDD